MSAEHVVIHYHRPPDRIQRFEQRMVLRSPACVITLLEAAAVDQAMVIDDTTVLEPGSAIVWFTFPGAWHDIGRFHTSAGAFTGFYANVLTPVEGIDGAVWTTTDLFLDLWLPRGGAARILDADELTAARAAGVIEPFIAVRAQKEAAMLLRAAQSGVWPPATVHAWTLERVRGTFAARVV